MGQTDRCSILLVTQYFPPETGACPTRMNELSSRWAQRGHDVTILTSAPDYPEGEIYDDFDNGWIKKREVGGVDVVYLKTIPSANSGFLRRGVKFVWFMLLATVVGVWMNRRDVVIATSPQPLTGPAAWAVASVSRSKFVFEVRDLWPESITSLSDISEWVLVPLQWIVEFTYRRADRVVAVSPDFDTSLEQAGVDPDDILVHYNGVSPEYFEHDGQNWQVDEELISELQNQFVVSYIGTLGLAHGISVVLDAAAQLEDDVLFLIVGTGARAEHLRSEAERRGIDTINFAGRHPKDHVPDFLALSDLALVHLKDKPIFRTAVPSKMFEAMAAGVPVLLGVRGTAERIVADSDVGITFEPEDSEDLVAAIRELQEDTDRREELGTNGRKSVAESFSWDQIAESYATDLQQLVNE